jgi:hypothetical protein
LECRVDNSVIWFYQGLVGDFTVKNRRFSQKRKGKLEYLNDAETKRMIKELQEYFVSMVEIPLIKHGKRQRIETLINEETLLLAKNI